MTKPLHEQIDLPEWYGPLAKRGLAVALGSRFSS